MDRAFWCLHDHVSEFAILGLPTLITSMTLAAIFAALVRTWSFDPLIGYVLYAIVLPVLILTTVTFLPLPCTVFAWFQATGNPKSVGQCFAWCFGRSRRLLGVLLWLVFSYTWWFLLFGIPMLLMWARTCQAPMVALFEDQKQIFRRSRQLMREDSAIHVLAGLFFLLTLVVASLIPLPRLILFAKLFRGEWTTVAEDSLWAFELVCGVLLLCGVAICWCVSLTLFYHDLRLNREGEAMRKKVDHLYEKYAQQEHRVS